MKKNNYCPLFVLSCILLIGGCTQEIRDRYTFSNIVIGALIGLVVGLFFIALGAIFGKKEVRDEASPEVVEASRKPGLENSAEFVTRMLTFLTQGDVVGFRKFIEENIDQVDSNVISTLETSRDFNPTQKDMFDTLLHFFERCQAVGMAAAFDEWERADSQD